MKNEFIRNILILALGALTAQISAAQGTTTFLSNLGQTPVGSNPVASDSWLAAGFYTGNNVGGYLLNSIQLGMGDASGTPGGFSVIVYSSVSGVGTFPGSSLGVLAGSANPATSGVYEYTAPPELVLSPGTLYYIVLTAGTTAANGAYDWNFLNSSAYQPTDGWLANVTSSSGNGTSWTRLGSSPNYDYSEFAINATPAPEPGVIGLFALGGLFAACQHRKTRPL
jgi:hypothetical protein